MGHANSQSRTARSSRLPKKLTRRQRVFKKQKTPPCHSLCPEVLNIVRQNGWRALVQDVQWRKRLAQWCCLCGAWCASNRAVKMHLAKSHREVWNPRKSRIELICKTQEADIIPCSLCVLKVTWSLARSSSSRSSLPYCRMAAAAEAIFFMHLLPVGSQTPQSGPMQGVMGSEATNKRPRTEGDTKGKGKRRTKPGKGQGRSGQHLRQDAPDGGSHSQAGTSAVRHTSDDSAGLQVQMVRQQGRGRRSAGHVRSQCRVEAH